MRRLAFLAAVFVLACCRPAAAGFVTFESGQVRPLALSPDGTRLFAVNTPDGQLEIFDVDASGLRHTASVPVGMEPVAVAARSDDEVWVVNHLSDSVSVVQLTPAPARVVRTLLVGDEPRDVVFAGPGRGRAFVTAAHRGQHLLDDPEPTTPGIGRADVWVFDTAAAAPGGTLAEVVTLFGDTPGALAVSPDGDAVYVAILHSGNQTTTVSEALVCDGGPDAPPCERGDAIMPGGLPGPRTNVEGTPAPETGLIVRFDRGAGEWRDELGRDWSPAVPFELPDLDVFRLDAATLATTTTYAHVGTVLYGMAVNPVSGAVYVTNTEARNETRFEGPGIFGGTSVVGHQHESQVTVLGDAGEVTPRHLNPHIDYGVVPSPPGVKEKSLALPLGAAVSGDGTTLWVTAFGSGVVAAVDTAALEAGSFTPDTADHVALTGGGPSGVVVDEARGRLYVLTRFDDGVSVVDVASRRETAHVLLHNPEPASVVAGRPLLYDARATSSNGEAACGSCHVFGDNDGLAWDLGNPDDVVIPNPNLVHFGEPRPYHPMKGPMTTQSLRGMAAHGPMHWRGDRTGGSLPDGDANSEEQAFSTFIVAFEGLLGREAAIDDDAMARFGAFALQITYPPNPFRSFENFLGVGQQLGRDLFFGRVTDQQFNCVGCHQLTPRAGLFGGDGQTAVQGGPQLFKIPHLRNLYTKIGMFRAPGPQIRGFGFTHDGSEATLDDFLATEVFRLIASERRQLEEFLFAFDTNLAPIVGQQVTSTFTDSGATRLDLLLRRAAAGECELIVKGVLGGETRGWLGVGNELFVSDRAGEPPTGAFDLHPRAADDVLTYTCVPLGSGPRMAIDRDEDGFLDRDELDAGTDPADAASMPAGTPLPLARVGIRTAKLGLQTKQGQAGFVFAAKTKHDAAANRIAPPPRDTAFDPTTYGAALVVYGAGFTTDAVTYELPAAGWRILGSDAKPKGYRFDGKRTGSRVKRVVLKPDAIKVKGALAYSLDEPAQGRVAVRLVPGLFGEGGWCAVAPPKQRGRDASTAKSDRPGRFIGAPGTPAPEACPALP